MRINQATGKTGEDLAENFLKENGFRVIEKNFNGRYGEIDIIALDQDTLVFVEVKTRTSSQFGNPLEAITFWKLKTLIKTAQFYKLTHQNLPESLRIDAVAVELFPNGELKNIEHVKNISGF